MGYSFNKNRTTVTVRKSGNCNSLKSDVKVLFDTFSFKKKYYVFFLLMGWRISSRPSAFPSKGQMG